MKRLARNFSALAIASVVIICCIWFATGLPRTFQLRGLSATPGLLVYADETAASPAYRHWTGFIEKCPFLPTKAREFCLHYCEARTSTVVVRNLHPMITAEEVSKLKGMEIVNFLDLRAGPDANEVIECLVKSAPNLKILHLQGEVNERGMKMICRGLPELEDLYLVNATIEYPIPELETGLLKLQGMTFESCQLGRGFKQSLECRPDVKIAFQ